MGGNATADGAPAVRGQRSDHRLRRLVTWVLTFLVLLAVATVVNVSVTHRFSTLSPWDEFHYIDSLDKALHGDIAQRGELVGRYAREVGACRGIFVAGSVGNPCGQEQPDSVFPLGGVTAGDIHPPTYFFVTAAGVKAMQAMGIQDDAVVAGRYLGAVWFAVGALVWVYLGTLWGASKPAGVAVASAFAVSPMYATIHTYITPDNATVLVSALLFVAVTRWFRGEWPILTLAAASVFAIAFKVNNLVSLFSSVLLVLAMFLASTRDSAAVRNSAAGVGVLGVTGALAVAAWEIARRLIAVGPAVPHPIPDPPFDTVALLHLPLYHFKAIPGAGVGVFPMTPYLDELAWWVASGVLVAAAGAALWLPWADRGRAVAIAGFWSTATAAIFLSAVVAVQSRGGYLAPEPRYGLGAWVLAAVTAMIAATRRWLLVPAMLLVVWGVLLYLRWPQPLLPN